MTHAHYISFPLFSTTISTHVQYDPCLLCPMLDMLHTHYAPCLLCFKHIFSIPGMPHAHHAHSHKAPCPLCPMLIVPHAHYIQCFMCPSMSTSIMAHDNWVIIFPQQSLPHGIRIICSTTFYFVIPFSLFHLISFFMHY